MSQGAEISPWHPDTVALKPVDGELSRCRVRWRANRIDTPHRRFHYRQHRLTHRRAATRRKAHFAIANSRNNDLLERSRVAEKAGSARFLRHNEPITMEFLGSRLNPVLGERGIVSGAYCGSDGTLTSEPGKTSMSVRDIHVSK